MGRLPSPGERILRGRAGSAPGLGTTIGFGLVCVIVATLVPFRAHVTRSSPGLLLVLAVVGAGVVGGSRAAVVTAMVAALAYNLAFIRPYWTYKVQVWDD